MEKYRKYLDLQFLGFKLDMASLSNLQIIKSYGKTGKDHHRRGQEAAGRQ